MGRKNPASQSSLDLSVTSVLQGEKPLYKAASKSKKAARTSDSKRSTTSPTTSKASKESDKKRLQTIEEDKEEQ